MKKLGKLQEIDDVRQIWPNEAKDFTPWLSQDENIAILSEEIGIDITVSETESAIGDFAVDIFGVETGTERTVIIANQLEESDHDHLGKLLTYLQIFRECRYSKLLSIFITPTVSSINIIPLQFFKRNV